VRLLDPADPAGEAVDLPFLELDQELWDATGKRLTLFLDPGRIKRGLKPREEVGPILVEGKRYTLVIDRAWKDAGGNPLKETFRKTFLVLAPDDATPDPKTWKLQAPAAASRAPLVVRFPESLDHALLHRMLWIEDDRGRRVDGSLTVSDNETRFCFTPRQPWVAGTYHLVANKRLEDLAGNSIGRPFEVDAVRPIQRKIETETVRVPFAVRAASR
jgi:hypothetical protein